mmetsp:Transcript_8098/g.25282  ORF Transcript_8098/g.25282 Transcript_8098/m.25282 type:complete len:169 (+) Transcript_8098:343-849(+)
MLYGHKEFPLDPCLAALLAGGLPPTSAATVAPQRCLYVVHVEREDGKGTVDLMCPVCSSGVEAMEEVVDREGWGGRQRECTRDWLRGRLLDGGEELDCQVVDAFETHPYPPQEWPQKSNKHRRFFMYKMLAREVGVKGARNRAAHSACVRERIESLYGTSQVGFQVVQ